jgi:hypothetical protein
MHIEKTQNGNGQLSSRGKETDHRSDDCSAAEAGVLAATAVKAAARKARKAAAKRLPPVKRAANTIAGCEGTKKRQPINRQEVAA